MAAIAFQRTNYGTFNRTIGNLGGSAFHSIVVFIQAQKNPEVIRRILASYSDANVNTPNVNGRILVIKEQLGTPDVFANIDPRGTTDVGQAMIDQAINLKASFDLLRAGETITVPHGETWTIVLTAAYSQGDANGAPSDKLARLSVLGQTSTGGKKVETY